MQPGDRLWFMGVLLVAAITAIASLVTAVVTRWNAKDSIATQAAVNRQTLEHQRAMERDKDARTLRDARLARLRSHYIDAVAAANILNEFLLLAPLSPTQQPGPREQEMNDKVSSAERNLDALLLELMLESDSDTLREQIHEMYQSFRGYRMARHDAFTMHNDAMLKELQRNRENFKQARDRFLVAVRTNVAQLSQPLPILSEDYPLPPVKQPWRNRLFFWRSDHP